MPASASGALPGSSGGCRWFRHQALRLKGSVVATDSMDRARPSGDAPTVTQLSLVLTRGRRPSPGSRLASSRAQVLLSSTRSFLMSARDFVSKLLGGRSRHTRTPAWTRARFAVEALEGRRLMSHSGVTHHLPMMSPAHHHVHAE